MIVDYRVSSLQVNPFTKEKDRLTSPEGTRRADFAGKAELTMVRGLCLTRSI